MESGSAVRSICRCLLKTCLFYSTHSSSFTVLVRVPPLLAATDATSIYPASSHATLLTVLHQCLHWACGSIMVAFHLARVLLLESVLLAVWAIAPSAGVFRLTVYISEGGAYIRFPPCLCPRDEAFRRDDCACKVNAEDVSHLLSWVTLLSWPHRRFCSQSLRDWKTPSCITPLPPPPAQLTFQPDLNTSASCPLKIWFHMTW